MRTTKQVTSPSHSLKLRGFRISDPINEPWSRSYRIVEWIDKRGQLARRVVPGEASKEDVTAAVKLHVEGRKHILEDDGDSAGAFFPNLRRRAGERA